MSLDRDDLDARYPSAGQRCSRCGRRFMVLADEVGMHACPFCGEDGRDDDDRDE